MLYYESFMYHGYEVVYRKYDFGGCSVILKAHLGKKINSYRYREFSGGTVSVIVRRNGVRRQSETLEALEMPPRVKKIIKYIIAVAKEK